ncbi:hypothetical protein [Streptomyces sp. NPDC002671]
MFGDGAPAGAGRWPSGSGFASAMRRSVQNRCAAAAVQRSAACAYSYNGQTVRQDGTRSYYDGKGVPCGIKSTSDDYRYTIRWDDGSIHHVRGVQGKGSYTGTQGDSGALVFAVNDRTHRQARGIVSAGDGPREIEWTEATDILRNFGLKLNPHQ